MTVPIIIKLKTENNGKILNATREKVCVCMCVCVYTLDLAKS